MRIRRVSQIALLFGLLAFMAPAVPQDRGTAEAAEPPQQPTVIRSTTRLVQVTVVAQDKKGEPITGLKKEDFTLFDEGVPQSISVFAGASPAPIAPPNRLPPNVFTNRFDLKGQDPGAVSVVLFDLLNTFDADQSYVRRQILKFLQALKPQDHVAIYALTSRLILLHEFTQDAAALVNAVSHFTAKQMAAFDASHPEYFDVPALHSDFFWMRFQEAVNQANAEIAEQAKLDRILITSEALMAIAEHVAAIPGHKSLAWVSGGFPLQIGIGVVDANRIGATFDANARKTAEAFSRVNMAIYPVDPTGLVGNAAMSPSNPTNFRCIDCIPEAPAVTRGLYARQDLRDSERLLADVTGGQAFYGSNDVRDAMRRVFDDDRFAYTIGFYPNHGQWDGKFRKIKIQVKADGAKLRYRSGYIAFGNQADDENKIKSELRQAAISPIEATGLGMIVSGKAMEPPPSRNLELHIGIDPKQLSLELSQDHRKGALDLLVLQRDAAGGILSSEKQRISVNLGEKEFAYLARAAMVLDKHVTVEPQAIEIRVVVRDAASGVLGSVTLPAKSFFPENTVPAAMAKPSS